MRIGLDFDNTIACYGDAFYRAALEKGLIEPEVAPDKTSVRDHLRARGGEEDWIALQGYVYGARMDLARPFPGVEAFLRQAHARGFELRIVSLKTRHPHRGPRYDLHAEAFRFLERHALLSPETGLSADRVFFEPDQDAKLARILAEACLVFVDDLPELLAAPEFPSGTTPILFDPDGRHEAPAGAGKARSWAQLSELLLSESGTNATPGPSGQASSGCSPRRG